MTACPAYDVVVLGSGAAGLTAAFTAADAGARVVVIEKNSRIGGTSAWSGGHVWIPNNPHMPADSPSDSTEAGVAYLLALGRSLVDERLIRAFVENGPRMVSYLEAHAGLEFYAVPGLPDYHPEHPGGRTMGGRTMGTALMPFEELGDWKDLVEVSPPGASPDGRDGHRRRHPPPAGRGGTGAPRGARRARHGRRAGRRSAARVPAGRDRLPAGQRGRRTPPLGRSRRRRRRARCRRRANHRRANGSDPGDRRGSNGTRSTAPHS